MRKHVELKTGELFCGAGGLGLGFVLADPPAVRFRPLFAIDNDSRSLESFKCNFTWLSENGQGLLDQVPGIYCRDVETLRSAAVLRLFGLHFGELDLLLGGPPCQGYSTANRQGSRSYKAERNRLVKTFLDRLAEFQPRMFLMENVQGVRWTPATWDTAGSLSQPALLSDDETGRDDDESTSPATVQTYLAQMSGKMHYKVWHTVLDAADYGVPQHRYRFFIFGVHEDLLSAGESVNLSPYLDELKVTPHVTVLEAIGDLPAIENGQSWDGNDYHPGTGKYTMQMRALMANGDLHDHFASKHAEYVIERYKSIPEGKNWESIQSMMTNYRKLGNTHSNIYRRLAGDAPAVTISHYRKSMIIHPSQHRGLSMREACRLQSFPDWFRFQGFADQQRQQLANAVPPLMAAAVARAIANWWGEHLAGAMA